MKFNLTEEMEITDYEYKLGKEIIITDLGRYKSKRYVATFEDCSEFGSGDTMDRSIQNLCEKISGISITLNPHSEAHRERIFVPILIHTKLLNR